MVMALVRPGRRVALQSVSWVVVVVMVEDGG